MYEYVCPRCGCEQVDEQTRHVAVSRPLHPRVLLAPLVAILLLIGGLSLALVRTMPELFALYQRFITIGSFVVVVLVFLVWFVATRRERVFYVYRCARCKSYWSVAANSALHDDWQHMVQSYRRLVRWLQRR